MNRKNIMTFLGLVATFLLFVTSAASAGPDEDLSAAAERGDALAITEAILDGAKIDSKDGSGLTPLMKAASSGSLKTVKFLVEKGANVDAESSDGACAISIATEKGYEDVVKYLTRKSKKKPVEKKVVVEASPAELALEKRQKEASDELLRAALYGDVEGAKSALDKGADINAKNSNGLTTLMLAVNQNLKELFDLALSKKADVNLKDNEGGTALTHAFIRANDLFADLLIEKGAKFDVKGPKAGPFLESAIRNNNDYLAAFFIENGADFKDVKIDGLPSLIFSIDSEFNDLARLLLEKGVDPNAKDKKGVTALMYASEYHADELVKLLKAKGADVNAKDGFGLTVAYYASIDIRRIKYITRVRDTMLVLRSYLIDFMDEKVNFDTNEVQGLCFSFGEDGRMLFYQGQTTLECETNDPDGQLTIITRSDKGHSQKRAPYGGNFVPYTFELMELSDDKYSKEKVQPKLAMFFSTLVPFVNWSNGINTDVNELFSVLRYVSMVDNVQLTVGKVEGAEVSGNRVFVSTVDEEKVSISPVAMNALKEKAQKYVDAYQEIRENIANHIKAIESDVQYTLDKFEAEKLAAAGRAPVATAASAEARPGRASKAWEQGYAHGKASAEAGATSEVEARFKKFAETHKLMADIKKLAETERAELEKSVKLSKEAAEVSKPRDGKKGNEEKAKGLIVMSKASFNKATDAERDKKKKCGDVLAAFRLSDNAPNTALPEDRAVDIILSLLK